MSNITPKKKRNVYSFALKKTDSPKIKEFIENQSNFSETVRYLIYKYLTENNTDDISYKFNELIFNNFSSTNLVENNNISNNTDNFDTNISNNISNESSITLDTDDIPSCYK